MKTPFEIITDSAIKNFGLEESILHMNLYVEKYHPGHAVNVDSKTFDMLMQKNEVDPDTFDINLYTDEKCYILPGNTRTLERYKELLKRYNISVTNDHTKADFIIGNRKIFELNYANDNLIISKNTSFYCCNGYRQTGYNVEFKGDNGLEERFYMAYNFWPVRSKADDHFTAYKKLNYIVGGTFINIIESGKPIIDESLFKKLEPKIVITEDIVENITNMLYSGDNSNKKIVAKILPTIDCTKNQPMLFKMFQDISYKFIYAFNKDKDVKNWIKDSRVHLFYSGEIVKAIEHYHNNNILTNEGFRYLEQQARQNIHITNRELYNFKVVLKDEYRKYYKKGQ